MMSDRKYTLEDAAVNQSYDPLGVKKKSILISSSSFTPVAHTNMSANVIIKAVKTHIICRVILIYSELAMPLKWQQKN